MAANGTQPNDASTQRAVVSPSASVSQSAGVSPSAGAESTQPMDLPVNEAAPNEAPVSPQKNRRKPPLLAIGAALFVLGGGAIAYLNFSQNAPRGLSPAGTQLVPRSALATLTLTTDELTWTKLRQFGNEDTQPQVDRVLRQWKDLLFTNNGYSFKRDIKPWIGDRVTLAMLPPKGTKPADLKGKGFSVATQNMVLLVPIADPLKAKDLLEVGAKNPAVKIEPRAYKGIDVKTITTPEGLTVQLAVVGQSWLLLSNTQEGIEQAIETHKGGRSLLGNSDYRKAVGRLNTPQPLGKNFAQVYFNIPSITQVLDTPTGAQARQGSLVPLQGSQGLVATALVETEGLRLLGTSWLSPKNDLAYSQLRNEAGEMPRRLPHDTLITMTGSNLQQFWQGFSEGKTIPPFFPNPQNLKAGLLTQTGLDIDEDIMPWAAGEFAVGLLPPAQLNAEQPSIESGEPVQSAEDQANDARTANESLIESAPLVMMVEASDRQMAESVWSQLDDVMVSRYRYQVETTEFAGGSLTNWISPFQGVQFSHGWLPGNVTFFALGDGAANALTPKPNRPLSDNRTFQTLTDEAPQPNNGHFYIDLARINELDGVFPLPQLPDDSTAAAIQALGLTATVGDRTMDYDLYVKLAQGKKPEKL